MTALCYAFRSWYWFLSVTHPAYKGCPFVSPLVRVDNVSKTYGNGTVALEEVSLEVAAGEFVSLVGPSGCGKSTLLRLVAGLGEVTAGEISVGEGRLGGLDVKGRAFKATELGFVFQDATLLPWRTVEANVALPLELAGTRKRARLAAAREGLALVGLADVAGAYPNELSGGMQMRVSIARALVTRPDLLLMDEPFGALDEITRQRLNDELLELRARTGATVLFVTHNVFEAVYLSDRILVMSARPGRIMKEVRMSAQAGRGEAFRGSRAFSQGVMAVTRALRGAGPQETFHPDLAEVVG